MTNHHKTISSLFFDYVRVSPYMETSSVVRTNRPYTLVWVFSLRPRKSRRRRLQPTRDTPNNPRNRTSEPDTPLSTDDGQTNRHYWCSLLGVTVVETRCVSEGLLLATLLTTSLHRYFGLLTETDKTLGPQESPLSLPVPLLSPLLSGNGFRTLPPVCPMTILTTDCKRLETHDARHDRHGRDRVS